MTSLLWGLLKFQIIATLSFWPCASTEETTPGESQWRKGAAHVEEGEYYLLGGKKPRCLGFVATYDL